MTSAVPETMTAVEIPTPGGPEALVPGSRAVPRPGDGEVLIAVAAAGVNYPDVAQRRGTYPPPPGASDIPGLEVAGTIAALGPNTTGWKLGDAVCALVPGGGYAEYCVTPGSSCLPVPKGLGMKEAAALPETFFTVWTNLIDRGRLAPGETVLIHGGSGGIGTAGIQVAKAMGARVLATARTADKCRLCEEIGAEHAINYKDEDFVAVSKELTGGKGVDVILDMVGGDYVQRNIEALAVEGRLVQIATLGGAKATVFVPMIMQKRLTVTGSTLRPRSVADKAAIASALRAHIWPKIESGAIRPVMHAEFALRDAAKAHELMETGNHVGKIVLNV